MITVGTLLNLDSTWFTVPISGGNVSRLRHRLDRLTTHKPPQITMLEAPYNLITVHVIKTIRQKNNMIYPVYSAYIHLKREWLEPKYYKAFEKIKKLLVLIEHTISSLLPVEFKLYKGDKLSKIVKYKNTTAAIDYIEEYVR